MFGFKGKLLWQFSLKSVIKETNWPAMITENEIYDVILVVQGMQE